MGFVFQWEKCRKYTKKWTHKKKNTEGNESYAEN